MEKEVIEIKDEEEEEREEDTNRVPGLTTRPLTDAGRADEQQDVGETPASVIRASSLRLRKRSLYHLRIGPTTVLPLVLILHDPHQIERICPSSSSTGKGTATSQEDEGSAARASRVAEDGEIGSEGGAEASEAVVIDKKTAPEFLRALTSTLRNVLAAYVVASPLSGHVWLEVPPAEAFASSSGGLQLFSMPGWGDVRFTYRFTPTAPRYAVMTARRPSTATRTTKGRKRASSSGNAVLESASESQESSQREQRTKRPRQDQDDDADADVDDHSVGDQENEESSVVDKNEEEAGEEDPSEERHEVEMEDEDASEGSEEEEQDESNEDEDDEEGLSENELMERRRKQQMHYQSSGYRGYAVTRHTLVVEALSSASAAAMGLDLTAETDAPPAHKLSRYFSTAAAGSSSSKRGGGQGAKRQRKALGPKTKKTKKTKTTKTSKPAAKRKPRSG